MLQKLISIKNVGKIKKLSASGDCEFAKSTLIFGENATGKTTLVTIFRSLKDNSPNLLIGRKSLGTSDEIEIDLRFDSSNIKFKDNSWDSQFSDIEIFDSKFISDNVFHGTYVDLSNRRKLQIYALGEESVALSREVIKLDVDIRSLQSEIRSIEERIRREIIGAYSIESFIGMSSAYEVDTKIKEKEKLIEELKESERILNRPLLTEINYPTMDTTKLDEILQMSLENVSEEAEKKVQLHLKNYFNDDEDESWLRKGLSHIKEDTCPFCEQNLNAVQIVDYYKQYFAEE